MGGTFGFGVFAGFMLGVLTMGVLAALGLVG